MLNLLVTICRENMFRVNASIILIVLWAASLPEPARAQVDPEPGITSPLAGDVLQGTVAISGTSSLDGFAAYELSFSYFGDTSGTWFKIAAAIQPVSNDILTSWDTSALTDGNYNIRLRIFLGDGSTREFIVENVRVRNYSSIETPTPSPTPVQATPSATITPTSTLYPTPTQLPTNPAVLTTKDVTLSVGYGGGIALVGLIILGIYAWIRRR